MITIKTETETCTICSGENCDGCFFNASYKNRFVPNTQTKSMLKDGYINPEAVDRIHRATMETRMEQG